MCTKYSENLTSTVWDELSTLWHHDNDSFFSANTLSNEIGKDSYFVRGYKPKPLSSKFANKVLKNYQDPN